MTAVGPASLTLETAGGPRAFPLADAQGLTISRGGRSARVADLRQGDTATVILGPGGRPIRIEAQAAAAEAAPGPDLRWLWYSIPLLGLLLAPYVLIWLQRRRGDEPFVVERK